MIEMKFINSDAKKRFLTTWQPEDDKHVLEKLRKRVSRDGCKLYPVNNDTVSSVPIDPKYVAVLFFNRKVVIAYPFATY